MLQPHRFLLYIYTFYEDPTSFLFGKVDCSHIIDIILCCWCFYIYTHTYQWGTIRGNRWCWNVGSLCVFYSTPEALYSLQKVVHEYVWQIGKLEMKVVTLSEVCSQQWNGFTSLKPKNSTRLCWSKHVHVFLRYKMQSICQDNVLFSGNKANVNVI